MSEINYLDVSIRARYYSAGSLNDETECVVLAFHGYGQLASYFIRNFESIERSYVVVPEGLHRFYLKGTEGRVGASWMTKEDRMVDIENQSNYINAIYAPIKKVKKQSCRFIVLGFSQGVSTALRWMVRNNIKVDTFVAWAGSFPLDLEAEAISKTLRDSNFIQVIGDKDPYFNEEQRTQLQDWIDAHSLHVNTLSFSGEHQIDRTLLHSLVVSSLPT